MSTPSQAHREMLVRMAACAVPHEPQAGPTPEDAYGFLQIRGLDPKHTALIIKFRHERGHKRRGMHLTSNSRAGYKEKSGCEKGCRGKGSPPPNPPEQ